MSIFESLQSRFGMYSCIKPSGKFAKTLHRFHCIIKHATRTKRIILRNVCIVDSNNNNNNTPRYGRENAYTFYPTRILLKREHYFYPSKPKM